MSRYQLVEMVPELIITERKARSFYCFNWQLSLDSCLREFGDCNWAGVSVCVRERTCANVYVYKGRWKEKCVSVKVRMETLGGGAAAVCVLAGR